MPAAELATFIDRFTVQYVRAFRTRWSGSGAR